MIARPRRSADWGEVTTVMMMTFALVFVSTKSDMQAVLTVGILLIGYLLWGIRMSLGDIAAATTTIAEATDETTEGRG